jgi:hypothetical protein
MKGKEWGNMLKSYGNPYEQQERFTCKQISDSWGVTGIQGFLWDMLLFRKRLNSHICFFQH